MKADTDIENLFPLVGWETGMSADDGVFILAPLFLSHSMQAKSEAQRDRWYALSAEICRALSAELLTAADQLERHGERAPSGLRH